MTSLGKARSLLACLAAVALLPAGAPAQGARAARAAKAAAPRELPPVCTFIPGAGYPEGVADRTLSGEVLVQVEVDRQGRVAEARALPSALPAPFAEEALRVVRRGLFEPARHEGRPAAGSITLAVRFLPAVRLRVTEAGLGQAVIDQKLDKPSDRFTAGESVAYLTRVQGALAGDTLRHVWTYRGLTVLSEDLALWGADCTVWSALTVDLNQSGPWSAEARDAQGRVLARREFQCLPGEAPPDSTVEEEEKRDRGTHP